MNAKTPRFEWKPERIRSLREILNRTQREMAVLVGVTERTIFRWEKGEVQPRRKIIRQLEKIEQKLTDGESKRKTRRVRKVNRRNPARMHQQKANEQMQIRFQETVRALRSAQELLRQINQNVHSK